MYISGNNDFFIVLKNFDLIISTVLYMMNKFQLFNNIEILKCYGNDIICGYVFSRIASYLYIKIMKEKIEITFLLKLIATASVFWEFISPLYKLNAVKDLNDLIAYFIGCVIFVVCKIFPNNEYYKNS